MTDFDKKTFSPESALFAEWRVYVYVVPFTMVYGFMLQSTFLTEVISLYVIIILKNSENKNIKSICYHSRPNNKQKVSLMPNFLRNKLTQLAFFIVTFSNLNILICHDTWTINKQC